jgi:predicted ester cyclase
MPVLDGTVAPRQPDLRVEGVSYPAQWHGREGERRGKTMSTEQNKAVTQRIWKEVLNERGVEKADEFVASDYVYHGPGGHELKGIEGFKKLMAWIHDSFPGVHYTVDDLIAEGDKVVSFYTVKGTDKGNRQVDFQGIMICRMVDGKEVEVWEVFDRLAIASQIAPGWARAILRFIERQLVKEQP